MYVANVAKHRCQLRGLHTRFTAPMMLHLGTLTLNPDHTSYLVEMRQSGLLHAYIFTMTDDHFCRKSRTAIAEQQLHL